MSAATGLIWEEWRRTRRLTMSIAGVLAAVTVVLGWHTYLGPWLCSRIYDQLSIGIFLAFLIFLLVSQSSTNEIQAGIPARRYLLPVSTFKLVLWPLLYRVTLLIALAAAICAVSIWVFHEKPGGAVETGCVLVAIAVYAHLVAWSARLVGKWIAAAGWFAVFYPGLKAIDRYNRIEWLDSPFRELMLPILVFAVVLPLTVGAVSVVRSGGPPRLMLWRTQLLGSSAERPRAAAKRRDADRAFPSAVVAQTWFEWRAMGKKMAMILCCPTCAMMALLTPVAAMEGQEPPYIAAWFFLALITMPAGLWVFAKVDASTRRDAARLIHALPVDDRLLALGRLGAAALTVGFSFAFVTAFVGVFWWLTQLLAPAPAVNGTTNSDMSFAAWFAMFLLLTGVGWVGYTRGGFFACLVIGIALFGEAITDLSPSLGALWWQSAGGVPWFAHVFVACAAVQGVAVGAWAWRRGALSVGALVVLCIACAVVAASWFLVLTTMVFNVAMEDIALIATAGWAIALALCVLSPVPVAAIRVQRLRHRL